MGRLREVFEGPANLVTIAVAVGTPEQKKIGMPRRQIDQLLNSGIAEIQAKLLMLEAYKLETVGNKRMAARVNKTFMELANDLGVADAFREGSSEE